MGKLVAIVAGIVFLASSCGGGNEGAKGPSTPPPQSSSSPKPSQTPASPSPKAISLSKGQATVEVKGGIKETLVLPVGPDSVYAPAPGDLAVTWLDRSGNALIIRGTPVRGATKTSAGLTLSLVLQTGRPHVFAAKVGSCTVKFTKEQRRSFSGTFTCPKLTGDGKTIHVRGSFAGKG